jgi:hypothetical protein
MASVVNVGNSCLIIEKEGSWTFPLTNFFVIFDSNPMETLKYGPNGYHLAEHILWNLISLDHKFIHSNASTFSSGEMIVYGNAHRTDFSRALKSFYAGLTLASRRGWNGKIQKMFHIEQKRVTSETNQMEERSVMNTDGTRMFTYNPDILLNEYPPDYVWDILLQSARLGHIFVQSQHPLTEEEIALFKAEAGSFEEAWKKRAQSQASKIPMFFAPPISLLMGVTKPEVLLSFDQISNPIERTIILKTLKANINQFNMKGSFDKSAIKHLCSPKYDDDRNERFFLSTALSGTTGPIEEEWVNDLLGLTDEEIVKKYGPSAMASFKKALKGVSFD